MRIRRMQRAEERAAMLSAKMTVPLVVCFLPTLLVVIIGPALVNLVEAFEEGTHPMTRHHGVRALCLAALAAVACAGPTRSGDPAARSVRQGLAEQAAANGDWPTAFRTTDALVAEDQEDGVARQLRARSLRHLGMAKEAEADLRQILAREPSRAEAHGELGVVLDIQGRFAEGFAEHQEAHRLSPWDPRWLNNLAFALVLRGKPKDAIPMLEEALRAEPTSPRLRNNLGFALAASGDFSRAAQQFRLAGPEAQAAEQPGVRVRARQQPPPGLRPVPPRDPTRPGPATRTGEPRARGRAARPQPTGGRPCRESRNRK